MCILYEKHTLNYTKQLFCIVKSGHIEQVFIKRTDQQEHLSFKNFVVLISPNGFIVFNYVVAVEVIHEHEPPKRKNSFFLPALFGEEELIY